MCSTENDSYKRQKLDCSSTDERLSHSSNQHVFRLCTALFGGSDVINVPTCEGGLTTRDDLNKLKDLFEFLGFRTSVIMSPRKALSIYRDSCILNDDEYSNFTCLTGKLFLVTMFGLHPLQNHIEHLYCSIFKELYCISIFLTKIIKCYPNISEEAVSQISNFEETRNRILDLSLDDFNSTLLTKISPSLSEMLTRIMNSLVLSKVNLRLDLLRREYDQILSQNCTCSNVLVQLFRNRHCCNIKEVYFKRSDCLRYERFTIYLYDSEIDHFKPSSFTFLPCLTKAILEGPDALCQQMESTYWKGLLEFGYYASPKIKGEMAPFLRQYFMSGITKNQNLPLLLNSHFDPSLPLSFYFFGEPGSGKSSLVKHFSPALNYALNRTVDAEILVRFVKQNLNKPLETLKLEMELRPNNNDLSVMSIIQGRRMTLSQSKPGLVVVDFEEMGKFESNANPDQLRTSQLISMRFSGRNGKYSASQEAPRNSAKRGISGDSTLIVLFTSNYRLEPSSLEALQRIETFSNLQVINMEAVEGINRENFAKSYVLQAIERLTHRQDVEVNVSIPIGTGDTRPLVRFLRILAFYVYSQALHIPRTNSLRVELSYLIDSSATLVRVNDRKPLKLIDGEEFGNWYPSESIDVIDPRSEKSVAHFYILSSFHVSSRSKLRQVLDLYFTKSLTPTVVASNNLDTIEKLCQTLAGQDGVHYIPSVVVKNTKMMKSLYDPSDLPNLKDDIMKFGKGSFVVIQLLCDDIDDQLCIREMIEDSPSMNAFSSEKSALYKEGLLFCIHIKGQITPEVRSRSSLIL